MTSLELKGAELGKIFVNPLFDLFTLQITEEGFGHRVFPTIVSSAGNRPLEPRALEVDFFPMEEVLHEKVKIH